jgi:hypothetical protein
MPEDRVSQDLIGELYERYMRGELTLDAAAKQIFDLMHRCNEPSGLAVILGELSAADQARTAALFDRVAEQTVRPVLPDADLPASKPGKPEDLESGKGEE